jgi:predicted transposase/invertase (TIGR01784 family)
MTITDKYIDPFTDFGFKHIFGTEENKRFLISFLNDLLDIEDKIIDLEYWNLEKMGLSISDRKAIFDVYCTDEKNNKFIVELQRSKQEYFKDRSVYYTTFPIQEQSKKGFWN